MDNLHRFSVLPFLIFEGSKFREFSILLSDTELVEKEKERTRAGSAKARIAKRINDAKKYRQKLRPLKTAKERAPFSATSSSSSSSSSERWSRGPSSHSISRSSTCARSTYPLLDVRASVPLYRFVLSFLLTPLLFPSFLPPPSSLPLFIRFLSFSSHLTHRYT